MINLKYLRCIYTTMYICLKVILVIIYHQCTHQFIDGRYNNINYKICIQICNKKLLKHFEHSISDVFNLIKAIDIISLDIYYYIGEGDMEKVFFNLNNFLKDAL